MADLADPKYQLAHALRMARERGEFQQLLAFLESDSAPQFAGELLAFLHDLIRDGRITRPKRAAGRPRRKKTASDLLRRQLENYALCRAVEDVPRLKRVWRKRYGRKYRVHDDAVGKAAERRGVEREQIINQIKMSRSDPRKL